TSISRDWSSDVCSSDLIVATTAYFVVSEAVANALRHAAASRIRVSVRDDAGVLRVRVEDDGRGGPALRPEGGLTGLADRVGALAIGRASWRETEELVWV